MFDIFFTLTELIILLSIFILIFFYSTLSSDSVIAIVSLTIYLIIYVIFLYLLNYFESFINLMVLENEVVFESIILFSKIIVNLMGAILFIELIYLLLFN